MELEGNKTRKIIRHATLMFRITDLACHSFAGTCKKYHQNRAQSDPLMYHHRNCFFRGLKFKDSSMRYWLSQADLVSSPTN